MYRHMNYHCTGMIPSRRVGCLPLGEVVMRAWAVGLGLMIHLGGSLDAYALNGHRRITQYAQTHFASRDGMPHSFSQAIVQTSDGYLWSASQEGLARFDGSRFTIFDRRNTI